MVIFVYRFVNLNYQSYQCGIETHVKVTTLVGLHRYQSYQCGIETLLQVTPTRKINGPGFQTFQVLKTWKVFFRKISIFVFMEPLKH